MKIWEPALRKAKGEAAMMQEMIDNEEEDLNWNRGTGGTMPRRSGRRNTTWMRAAKGLFQP